MTLRTHRRIAAALAVVALLGAVATARAIRPGIRGELLGTGGVVMQRTQADCGLAALATWARLQGRAVPAYEALLRRHAPPPGGFSLLALTALADSLGAPGSAWQLAPDAFETAPLPLIVHLRGRPHYVVLVQRGTTWLVADPAIGMIRASPQDVLAATSGAVLAPDRSAGPLTAPRS